MEFKEYKNPEQADYDIKIGSKTPTFIPPVDNSLNTNETFEMPQVSGANPNFQINEFGEIIRGSEGLTIYNMPEDVLMQFAENGYIWKVQRTETRGGNYQSDTPSQYTEVFRQDGDGTVRCEWSGRLVNNPAAIKEDEFVIFSGDMDTNSTFQITMPLVAAPE